MQDHRQAAARMVAAAELRVGAHAALYQAAFLLCDEVGMEREKRMAQTATDSLLQARSAMSVAMFPSEEAAAETAETAVG